MRKIKVLVVEDSKVFCEVLVKGLSNDPNIHVVATASNPYDARDAILKFHPDVMTLDIGLPRMDGIEFLRKLMPQYPIPVVVVSSINEAVFDALSAGAVEFVHKPTVLTEENIVTFINNEVITKVKIASTAKVGKYKRVSAGVAGHTEKTYGNKIIAIGASTGGTEAIFNVIRQFDADIPGIVIVQHMPPKFTQMYATRLNNQCRIVVKEAKTGDIVQPGQALIAPGDYQMKVVKINGKYQVECKHSEKVNGHCPSVDVLFDSVANTAGRDAIGVIMTGMGADGARGLLKMRENGATTIGQDEASCIVYGMPKVAYEIGAVTYQSSLDTIASKVYSALNANK